MAKQKLVLKKKKKQEYKTFEKACEDAAEQINGVAKELTSKMWEVGRILVTERNKVNPKYKGQFYAGVAERMKEELAPSTLYGCAKFYERYPDLLARQEKTKLPSSHYIELAKIPNETEREEYEQQASDKGWTREELRQQIAPEPMGFEETANDVANDILTDISNLTDNINKLIKEMNMKDLSEGKKERLLTSIGVLLYKTLAKLVKELRKYGAKPDKNILKLMGLEK